MFGNRNIEGTAYGLLCIDDIRPLKSRVSLLTTGHLNNSTVKRRTEMGSKGARPLNLRDSNSDTVLTIHVITR